MLTDGTDTLRQLHALTLWPQSAASRTHALDKLNERDNHQKSKGNAVNKSINFPNIAIAVFAVFVGSLLSDTYFGDGVQIDDIQQALVVALIAGVLQH